MMWVGYLDITNILRLKSRHCISSIPSPAQHRSSIATRRHHQSPAARKDSGEDIASKRHWVAGLRMDLDSFLLGIKAMNWLFRDEGAT